jgi:dihydroorotate dehydrogenase (NAD+) catalytic subunit
MIKLSNGHELNYVVASGSLGFDGQGWPWEWPLVWLGLMKPELFTVVIKSLTRHPRKGNLRWWKPWTWLPWSPWSCVRFLPGGAVNKVGLTNPGIEYWCREIGPFIDYQKYAIVGSIFGTRAELVEMAQMLNEFEFVALEVNVSCPNTGHALEEAEEVVGSVKAVKLASRHPIIVKVSVDQDYCFIARGLKGVAEAADLNSVAWSTVFTHGEVTPLAKLEKKVGGGGGGVSGWPAQKCNWIATGLLAKDGHLPVIGPSVMEYADMEQVRKFGAQAVSFGTIHLRTPWRPTAFVKKEKASCRQ